MLNGEQIGSFRPFNIESYPDSLGAVEQIAPDRKMEMYNLLHLFWRKAIYNSHWLDHSMVDFFIRYAETVLKIVSPQMYDYAVTLVAAFASEMANDVVIINRQEFLSDEDYDLWVTGTLKRDTATAMRIYGYDYDAVKMAVIEGKTFETGCSLSPDQESFACDDISYYFDNLWEERSWRFTNSPELSAIMAK